jgi:hypothetical protein
MENQGILSFSNFYDDQGILFRKLLKKIEKYLFKEFIKKYIFISSTRSISMVFHHAFNHQCIIVSGGDHCCFDLHFF